MNKKISVVFLAGLIAAFIIPGITVKACSSLSSCISPDGDSICNSNCWDTGYSMGECGLQNSSPAGYVKSASDISASSCAKYSADPSKNTCYCKNEKPRGCLTNNDCVDLAGCHSCFNKTWYADNGQTPRFATSLDCQNHGNAICQCVSGSCQTTGAICGDGKCDPRYENITNCPADCTPCASNNDCISDNGACNICLSKAWLALDKTGNDNPICLNGFGKSICACEQNLCVRKSICGDGKCDQKYENTVNCPVDCVPTCAQACQNKGYSKSYCGSTLQAAEGLSPKTCNGDDYELYDPMTSDCDPTKPNAYLTCCCSGSKNRETEPDQTPIPTPIPSSLSTPIPTPIPDSAPTTSQIPQHNNVVDNSALLQAINAIRQQIVVLMQQLIQILSQK